MRKFTLFLFVCIALCFSLKPTQVKASHAAGAEIIYEWISDSTYRFFFKFYRDCTGIPEPATQPMCCYNSCTQSSFDVTLNKWTGALPNGGANGSPVSAGCSQYQNKCQNSASLIPGYEEWWYSAIITLPLQCNYWRFACFVSARNTSNNIPATNLYVETTFNNTGPRQGNSSPYFSIKPIPYVCVNLPYSYNNGAIDPNGDSLVTDVINPLDGSSCSTAPANITFNGATPPFSIPNNPLQSNNTFFTNNATGQMSFTASQQGPSTLTTRVREFRNGVLIGHIIRDVQVQVLPCTVSQPNLNTIANSVVGGSYNATSGQVYGCINAPLSFCWDVISPDANAILIVDDNHWASIPAATTTYYNNLTDSVRGCFSWTPGSNDTGLKSFIVTMKDSTCAPPGIMLFYTKVIPIYIFPATRGLGDSSVCPKGPAYLGAAGGGNYQWTILPGGTPGSLTCTNCPNPAASPLVTTKYMVVSTLSSFCSNNSDTVTVTVLPGPQFAGQADTVTCPRNPVMLNLKSNPPTGVKYFYKWAPVTGLSNDTLMNPITSTNKPITYIVTVSSSISKCKAYDTIGVDVLTGFKIDNPLDTFICEGDKVQIRANGDTRYNFSWTTNSTSTTFSNATIINPEISQNVVGKYNYTIKASFPSCPIDSVTSLNIEVQPIPTVAVDDDAILCTGDTMTLHGLVTPAGYPFILSWSPSASLDKGDVAKPLFTASIIGDNNLKLTATSKEAGCTNSDSMIITVFTGDFLTLSNDTAVCPGDSVQLHLTGGAIQSFFWGPDQNISNIKGTDPYVWPVATQSYAVYGVDTNHCADTQMVRITVKPAAVLDLPDTVRMYPGEAYRMAPGGNCLYYNWFPVVGLDKANIANPLAKPEVNTRYTVNGSTEFGCKTSAEINVMVMPDSYIDVPNAFMPGSSANSKLKPLHLGNAKLKTFAIYNRWGKKVFEGKDMNDGWDGTFNGETQPMGVYIYMIEATTPTGRTFTKQGNITLVR